MPPKKKSSPPASAAVKAKKKKPMPTKVVREKLIEDPEDTTVAKQVGTVRAAKIADKEVRKEDVKSKSVLKLHAEIPEYERLMEAVERCVDDNWKNKAMKKLPGYGAHTKDLSLFEYEDMDYNPNINVVDTRQVKERQRTLLEPTDSDKKAIDGHLTNFNTFEFFETADRRIKFVYLVVNFYSRFLRRVEHHAPELKGKLDVMFKGGTTIRILVRELIRNFDAESENVADGLFRESVKLSDYDFQLVMVRSVPEKAMIRICNLAFMAMLILRNYIVHHRATVFGFFALSTKEQKRRMGLVLRKINVDLAQVLPPRDPSYASGGSTKGHGFFYGCKCVRIEFDMFANNSDVIKSKRKGTSDDGDKATPVGVCAPGYVVDGQEQQEAASDGFPAPGMKDHEPRKQQYTKTSLDLKTFGYLEVNKTLQGANDMVVLHEYHTGVEKETKIGTISAYKLLKDVFKVSDAYVNTARFRSASNHTRLYVSCNPDIMSVMDNGEVMAFALNRIKYSYTLYFERSEEAMQLPEFAKGPKTFRCDLGGEVLDLSQSNFNDKSRKKYDYDHIDSVPFLRMFNMFENDLSYLGYTASGHYHDLYPILFTDTGNKPWMDVKYSKRLHRIIIVAALDYMTDETVKPDVKVKYLEAIVESLKDGEEKLKKKSSPTKEPRLIEDLYETLFDCAYSPVPPGQGHEAQQEVFRDTVYDTMYMVSALFGSFRSDVEEGKFGIPSSGIAANVMSVKHSYLYQ